MVKYKSFGTRRNRVDYVVCEDCGLPIEGTAQTHNEENEYEGVVFRFCSCVSPVSSDGLIAITAWLASGNIKDGTNIGIVAEEIAATFWEDAPSVKKSILYGLRELSSEYFRHEDGSEYGVTHIGEDTCYWVNNNAYSEWRIDRPDWYDVIFDHK